MVLLLLLPQAFAGPVPMFGQAPTPESVRGPAPLPTTQRPLVWVYGVPPPPQEEVRAFPLMPPPATERTAWQQGKTRIEEPGSFVRIDQLPSAFQPIEPAVDRLQRPDLD